MTAWVANNLLYSSVIGVVLVIIGGGVAFKADNKFGYVLMAGGVALIVWAMRLKGLI